MNNRRKVKEMRFLATLAAALVLTQTGCVKSGGESDVDSVISARHMADLQAILELEQRVFDAQIAGDFEAWLSLFEEDAIVMEPNIPALTGKAAIRRRNSPYFEQFHLHEESDSREVEVAGDWGYIRAHWIWTLTPKDGGETVKDTGNSIWIVRKQPDGSWKIARGIFNSENPVPETRVIHRE